MEGNAKERKKKNRSIVSTNYVHTSYQDTKLASSNAAIKKAEFYQL